MVSKSKLHNDIEFFIFDTYKKFNHLNINSNILSLAHVLNNHQVKKTVLKDKNKVIFFNNKYKGYLKLKPHFKIVVKNKDGIIALELERKQKKGYKVLLKKSIHINPLNDFFKHIGIEENTEIKPLLEKEYDTFIDELKTNIYE
jgi:hypothetical protein